MNIVTANEIDVLNLISINNCCCHYQMMLKTKCKVFILLLKSLFLKEYDERIFTINIVIK